MFTNIELYDSMFVMVYAKFMSNWDMYKHYFKLIFITDRGNDNWLLKCVRPETEVETSQLKVTGGRYITIS